MSTVSNSDVPEGDVGAINKSNTSTGITPVFSTLDDHCRLPDSLIKTHAAYVAHYTSNSHALVNFCEHAPWVEETREFLLRNEQIKPEELEMSLSDHILHQKCWVVTIPGQCSPSDLAEVRACFLAEHSHMPDAWSPVSNYTLHYSWLQDLIRKTCMHMVIMMPVLLLVHIRGPH